VNGRSGADWGREKLANCGKMLRFQFGCWRISG
jgi:hypothetical protein